MASHSSVRNAFVRVIAASSLIAGSLVVPAAADDDMIRVSMDHARIIKLDRQISKVIVGSAAVADVAVADANTIVLTGKSYGTTNLVILDPEGQPIVDEVVLVSVDEANTLRIYRQTERSVFSCSPSCEEHVKSVAPTP
jgi:Flp pilus assembly secretin CpaC